MELSTNQIIHYLLQERQPSKKKVIKPLGFVNIVPKKNDGNNNNKKISNGVHSLDIWAWWMILQYNHDDELYGWMTGRKPLDPEYNLGSLIVKKMGRRSP